MVKYITLRLTDKEYELLIELGTLLWKKGLPMEIFKGKDITKYLKSVGRKNISKGAIGGIGFVALRYLIEKKRR